MNAAERVAAAARDHLNTLARKAATGDGDWRNPDIRDAFVGVLTAITVTADTDGVVRADRPDTPAGQVWHYLADEALRRACPDGTITRTGTTYVLTVN
jgi:hypothetical protein